jgi:hypothetical protein
MNEHEDQFGAIDRKLTIQNGHFGEEGPTPSHPICLFAFFSLPSLPKLNAL